MSPGPDDPGVIGEKVRQLEERAERHEIRLRELERLGSDIREELAGLRGEVRGALSASKLGGSVVGALVSFGGSAAIGLLIYLLGRR